MSQDGEMQVLDKWLEEGGARQQETKQGVIFAERLGIMGRAHLVGLC